MNSTIAGSSGGGPISPDEARAKLAGPVAAPVTIWPKIVGDTGYNPHYGLQLGHKFTQTLGDMPTIADQQAEPTKPPDKALSFSTYGVVIPISLGVRRMGGNVVMSTDVTSIIEGTYYYETTYQIPITTTDTEYGSWSAGDYPANTELYATVQDEFNRMDTITRIFQNNDPTSDNWVDVATPSTSKFRGNTGIVQTFNFNDS